VMCSLDARHASPLQDNSTLLVNLFLSTYCAELLAQTKQPLRMHCEVSQHSLL